VGTDPRQDHGQAQELSVPEAVTSVGPNLGGCLPDIIR
jgi:hypothetical protein